MLWAVPAKSPVAPRALAVLAFFLLLTLYLTWPLPLRMGSGAEHQPRLAAELLGHGTVTLK